MAKRRKGGGKHTKTPELGFDLFQWLVDTVDNIKSRVFGWMLMMQVSTNSSRWTWRNRPQQAN